MKEKNMDPEMIKRLEQFKNQTEVLLRVMPPEERAKLDIAVAAFREIVAVDPVVVTLAMTIVATESIVSVLRKPL